MEVSPSIKYTLADYIIISMGGRKMNSWIFVQYPRLGNSSCPARQKIATNISEFSLDVTALLLHRQKPYPGGILALSRWDTRSMLAGYSEYVHGIPGVCRRDTRTMLTGYLEYAHGILVISPLDTRSMLTGYLE